jgi:hypothetical protein
MLSHVALNKQKHLNDSQTQAIFELCIFNANLIVSCLYFFLVFVMVNSFVNSFSLLNFFIFVNKSLLHWSNH